MLSNNRESAVRQHHSPPGSRGVLTQRTVCSNGGVNMGKLKGKVALITGAASGMGRATALLFAAESAKVMVADCDSTGGQETVEMITRTGGEAAFEEVDVSDSADVRRMVKTTMDTFQGIDILFNHVGMMGPTGRLTEISEEGWDRVMEVNLKSVFLGCKYAIPFMLERGGGVIINTSSCQGIATVPGTAPYTVSKAGVVHLTRSIALEYTNRNIRANCICPGMIHTPMTEHILPTLQTKALLQRRIGEPEEVARAALYLASDDSSYVTGHALVVDGGWTIAASPPYK